MARVSFRLRQPAAGTALHEHETGTGDETDGLRADGLQLAPAAALSSFDSYFSATSTCYTQVDLEWYLPLEAAGGAGAPTPTTGIVVYSPYGPPETIPAGIVIAEGTDVFYATMDNVTSGEFAYFSLFVRYQSDDDDYYEKVSEVWELVPFNYGSTQSMWERIPSYYRELDSKAPCGLEGNAVDCVGFDNYGEPIGHLLQFLSIFGFEMDRTRTITNHISKSKDPEHADVESLSALSFEMGLGIDETDLGATRLRNLLNDVGIFRRSKGTVSGTEFFVRSLSSSTATVDTVAEEITVYSQRVNHITDPQNTKSVVDIESTRPAADDEAANPWEWNFDDTPPTSGGGTVYHLECPIDVEKGDVLSFSVHSGVGDENIKWARIVHHDLGWIYSHFSDMVRSVRDGVTYFDITSGVTTTVEIEYMVDDTTEPFVNSHYLLEKNTVGGYFDGSFVRGGWLTGVSNSISDYRWEGGAVNEHNARSLYNEDYERTRQVLDGLFQDVLPIDVAANYTITYNNVP